MTYEAWQVVRVPFPFSDRNASKGRPALIPDSKAFNAPSGHSVMAMITSSAHAHWPLDCAAKYWVAVGLPAASIIRFKLFTLDNRLVTRVLGQLSPSDCVTATEALRALFPYNHRGLLKEVVPSP